jgi:hypothetical protein
MEEDFEEMNMPSEIENSLIDSAAVKSATELEAHERVSPPVVFRVKSNFEVLKKATLNNMAVPSE